MSDATASICQRSGLVEVTAVKLEKAFIPWLSKNCKYNPMPRYMMQQ
jgi:hypothetical protein